jgi:hypothetical protein
MKKLPLSIQSFIKLKHNDCLYVDKTESIYKLITNGTSYFLSRPRRFGKSLLISTLEELFKGNKDLFEGLYIYDKWDWTQQNPVIRLDFGGINNSSPEELENDLSNKITKIAQNNNITISRKLGGGFEELIEGLHLSTGRQVVVLIDEYDKPIIDNISSPDVTESNKRILHDFYQVLKARDENLRFLLLTGVSKFSGISIFSGLNSPNDITIDDKYASICGYTQAELESSFSEYLDEMEKKRGISKEILLKGIRQWYNGYSWDGETFVYNPYSTLLLFDKMQFNNYWFRTGTPTFLIETIKKRNIIEPILEPVVVGSNFLESFDHSIIDVIPLLFQTGYLTIKKRELDNIRVKYTLDIPNNEVKESLLENLLNAYCNYPVAKAQDLTQRMQQQLNNCNTTGLEQSLKEMLAYIPFALHLDYEAYYHSLMLLRLKMLGFDIIGEVNTNIGIIDAVWKFAGHTIVAEVKCLTKKGRIATLLTNAIKQIETKRYYERFMGDEKVSLLSVVFAEKEIGCRMVVKKQ